MKLDSIMATKRALIKSLGAGIATASMPSFAQQAWPARAIKIVVPFTPGGTTDFVARMVAVELSKALGQAVVVENKPGAGTVIGVDTVAKSAADGYTLACVANSFCVNHTLVKKLPYDTLRDFRPVALMGMSEHVLATHPASFLLALNDIRTVSKSASLSYASFGSGTSAHLAGEMLKAQLGVDLVHVPYKGQAPALADLLGGQVSMMFGNWPEFRGHIQSGKLIALGMATAKRSTYAPTIPTLAEQGVPIESNSWNGLIAPANTPDSVVQLLNTEINKVLGSANVVQQFQTASIASLSGTTTQFSGFIQSEIKKYAQVIERAKISI
jgi:tripartite-type tricarboxylate transporter receptor subunit TctC